MPLHARAEDLVSGTRGLEALPEPDTRGADLDDEGAARLWLSAILEQDERPAVRSLNAPETTELVPDMAIEDVQEQRLTDTRLVRFHQTHTAIPIFGSRVVVELSQDRQLVSVNAEIADVEDLSPVPALSEEEARGRVADFTGVDASALGDVASPTLMCYYDEEGDRWHLVYIFTHVPAAPPEVRQEIEEAAADEQHGYGHGPDPSPRELMPSFDYLVDAHDGEVVFFYSTQPMIAAIPTVLRGVDELGELREFWGQQADSGSFELCDPQRNIKTYDLQQGDWRSASLPDQPVRNIENNWGDRFRAAISAHVNATHVYDFYNAVLQRDGVDDKDMELVSVVNCVDGSTGSPIWRNAVWWNKRMWYGQDRDRTGQLRSMARYLDIIAHELTHGVIDYTSNLVYRFQSGALNESFSDIFGVIIHNWVRHGADSDVDSWTWEIGAGWNRDGRPLRDLSNPRRTGGPDHMDDYLLTWRDSGGVHTNSNIHNKAAYNVLTATDDAGNRVFSPREVAVLYYLTLVRLTPLATFKRVVETMTDVARTFYAGDEAGQQRKIAALHKAYGDVGILR
jgi:Zn-dependent metalloprotease